MMGMSSQFLESLFEIVKSRRDKPLDTSYTSRLIAGGLQEVVSKFGEESSELIAAACGQGDIVGEAADVIFHLMVVLAMKNAEFSDVVRELERRRG